MNVVIFLGPSLPRKAALEILPSATFRPPAEQADIVSAVEHDHAEIIGLIDGSFRQSLSVWHSELLYALTRGVRIYGSSSIGALRAAETQVFGTIGVGRVFDWYASGTLTRDDEVAVTHSDGESEYVPTSEPAVNIRATLEAAAPFLDISPAVQRQAIDACLSLYYPDRTKQSILVRCEELGMSLDDIDKLGTAMSSYYVDVKRNDAQLLLERIRNDLQITAQSSNAPFEFAWPYVFETMYNHDRSVRRAGRTVPLQYIGERLALHSPEFQEIRRSALNGALVVFLGALLGVKLSDSELDAEYDRFCTDHSLVTPAHVNKWLESNDLNQAELRNLCRELAVCRKLQLWLLSNRFFDRGTRYVLNELRRTGMYEQWANQAAEEAECYRAYADVTTYATIADHPSRLAAEHAECTGIRLTGDVREWAEEAGFESAEGLLEALKRAAVLRDVKRRIQDTALESLLRGA